MVKEYPKEYIEVCEDCGCTVTDEDTYYDGQGSPICEDCFNNLYNIRKH